MKIIDNKSKVPFRGGLIKCKPSEGESIYKLVAQDCGEVLIIDPETFRIGRRFKNMEELMDVLESSSKYIEFIKPVSLELVINN